MKIKSNTEKTIINIISSLGILLINIVINFLMSPFLVQKLGTEVNGFIQLANNFIMYTSLITISLNSMASRFISIAHSRNEYGKVVEYYSTLIKGNIYIALIISPIILWFIVKINIFLNITNTNLLDLKLLFLFMFLNFFLTQIFTIFSIPTYALNNLYILNLINLIRISINGLGLFICYKFFTTKMYYVGIMSAISTTIVIYLIFYYKKKSIKYLNYNREKFSKERSKELIISGLWNTVNQCGNIFMTGLDLFLANIFINPLEMGILALGKIIPNTIIQIAATLNSSLIPGFVLTYAKEEKDRLIKQIRVSMKLSSMILIIPISIFLVFGLDFYKLWLPTVNEKKLLLISFLTILAFIPLAGTQILYNIFTTANKLKWNSVTFIAGGAINFIIVYIVLKQTNFGIYAIAGISSIITIVRNLIFVVPYSAEILGVKWYEFYKDIFVSIGAFTLVTCINLVFYKLCPHKSWADILIVGVLSLIADVFILVILETDTNQRKYYFKQIIQKGEKWIR